MNIPYDLFTASFLSKVSEYEFIQLDDDSRTAIVDGYMKRSINSFKRNCKHDFVTTQDDEARQFVFDDAAVENEDFSDLDEIIDIVSEGMVAQWLKQYVYRQELLENVLNTRDFTSYSPAELLMRVGNAYKDTQKSYTQMIREYSYNHGDLKGLHL